MNYLEPADVVDAVTTKLNSQITDFVYKDKSVQAIEHIARKPDSENEENGIQSPWLALTYFFNEEGEVLPQGNIYNLPITIGIISSSTSGQATDTEALREAMHYARIAFTKAIGDYHINIGTEAEPEMKYVILKSSKQPFEILEASSDLALVGVFFEYTDTF